MKEQMFDFVNTTEIACIQLKRVQMCANDLSNELFSDLSPNKENYVYEYERYTIVMDILEDYLNNAITALEKLPNMIIHADEMGVGT